MTKTRREDLTGQKYNYLTAISVYRVDSSYRVYWNCICDCGNFKEINSNALVSGTIKSCGCLLSSGGAKITKLLFDNGIEFATQYCFPGLTGLSSKTHLRFDFAIFKDGV